MCKLEVLFDVKHATVSEHISNILASGELDETSVGFSDRSTGGRKPQIYNLDMILSVGYRVNSKRGIAFRKWANNVLNRDPETKLASTQKGQTKVSRFPLVVKRNRTNKAFVVMITACGNNAEFVEKYLV